MARDFHDLTSCDSKDWLPGAESAVVARLLLENQGDADRFGCRCGVQHSSDFTTDKRSHLWPGDAMHLNRVDAVRDGDRMGTRHEVTAIDQVDDLVDGQDQVLSAISQHGGDRVGTGIRRPSVRAVVEIEETQRRVADQAIRNLLAKRGHQTQAKGNNQSLHEETSEG